jgi:succinoglycan biosynthesis transport protein ExoP
VEDGQKREIIGESGGFSLFSVWRALRKNWPLVGGICALVGLAATFYTLGQKKIYEASSTVLFDPQLPQPLGNQVQAIVDMGSGSYWNNKEYYKTQYWILQSMGLASQVVRDLNLHKDAAFLDNAPPGATPAPREVSVDVAAEKLIANLVIEPVKDSRLTVVRYRDADPARSQKILASLVDTYVQNNLDSVTDSTTTAADWLRTQHGSLKKELESSEMALHDYKKNKNILSVSMDDQSNMLREELKQVNTALTEVRTRREGVLARKAELNKVKDDDPANLPASELLNSVVLQGLRQGYVEAVRDRDALIASGKGANHPDVGAAQAKCATTRRALLDEVRNIKGAVDRDSAALEREMGGLQRLTESAKKRALELNLLEIEYNRLRRQKDEVEKLFSLVAERSKESDLTGMLRMNNLRVVDRPLLPKKPISPDVPVNIAVGILAGLLLGLAAAFGREQLDRSIKTPDDAEAALGMAFLGLLPELHHVTESGYGRSKRKVVPVSAERPELVVHEHPSSGTAEAARAVRTNILFMSPDRPFRTLLVTSAGPSEGKTTVACCIGIAMAQAGKRVVLVDCDMRRPRLHRVFRVPNTEGVTTSLLEHTTLPDTIHPTEVPNLHLLTTGPLPPNPAEILHSEAFARLLANLREVFDCVVIDSPPVAPVTDAAVLSAQVDGTVLVVRAFQTTRELARRAVRALRDVGGTTIGTILNAVNLDRSEYGYQHYYYYKREGYAQDEAPPSASDNDSAAPPPLAS